MLGLPGPGVGQPGATELRVVEALLAGATGAGGRLFQALREDRGLAYEVGAAAERGFGAGAFFLHIATDPGRVREARRGLRAELERLRREPVGAAELERVRRGLVDGAALGLQRAVSRAEQAAGCELWHGDGRRWRDRLRLPLEVGAEQILEVARHRLDPARAVEVTVGPAGAW
ncbi:MAG: M16 family metallopeptidase [bacterium]